MDIYPARLLDRGGPHADVLKEEQARRMLFVRIGILLALCLTLSYTVVYVSQGWWVPAIFNIPVCAAHAVFYLILKRNGSNALISGFFLLLIAQLFIISNLFLGQEAGIHHYLFCILPFLCIAFPQKKDITFIAVIGAAALIAFVFTEYASISSPFLVDLSGEALTFVHMASTTGSILLITGLVLVLYMDLSRAKNALASEHERSESLLLNILPGPIAHRLKASPDVIAETFQEASVLFADIAGFTALAANRSPGELVSILNRYFSCYDELAEKYRVEKIKTIGDAYMVAAGVPEARADHAGALLSMAAEMITITGQISRASGLDLTIRIGIHSGEVTAGVIGKKKFVYDLWGDTVNVASRMESHGVPGRVQVSPRTYGLLKDAFLFEHRGEIDIKGMGRQDVFLLKN